MKAVVDAKVKVALVIGGGNIFRGVQGSSEGIDRVRGDYMGMLATVINSLAVQDALMKLDIRSKIFSGLAIDPVCERMSSMRAIECLEDGNVVIIAGGTGNPYFTTDTASVLRALEIKADAILKGTRVDGVFSADPEKFPDAQKFKSISFDEAISLSLKIMDQTAFTLCRENKLPIVVFNMNVKGNLEKLIKGMNIGTIISNQ